MTRAEGFDKVSVLVQLGASHLLIFPHISREWTVQVYRQNSRVTTSDQQGRINHRS